MITFGESSKSVKFHQGSLTSAKDKAMEEGKLYFVDFVANYCYMCKMMDETTFRDERVVNYMEQNYVPVKINVDDFDGFVWKQKYNIKVLPTILIFNTQGDMVARHEESLGGTGLLRILESHNTSENRIIASSPKSSEDNHIEVPTSTPPADSPETNSYGSNTEETGSFSSHTTSIETNSTISSETPSVAAEGQGLFEFSVKRTQSTGFSIQIGVFQDYANVLQEVAKLESMFSERTLVHITRLNNKLAYRVLVGNFNSKISAENYHNSVMKNHGASGFVKNLSSLK